MRYIDLMGGQKPHLLVKTVNNLGGKTEVRARGPNVTPGYWKRPDLTAAAFDEEGFYRPGDAVRFADTADPGKGLMFDGRLAEDLPETENWKWEF